MLLNEFQTLSNPEIMDIIKTHGEKVLAIPFNGTRRWLYLEYHEETQTDFIRTYLNRVGNQMKEVLQLMFDHGISTILTPLFGSDHMKEDSDYVQFVGLGLTFFIQNPTWRQFFKENQIRVRFYGTYRKQFQDRKYRSILKSFSKIEEETKNNAKNRLFIGVFSENNPENIAELSIEFYKQHNRIPSYSEIIELYYGEKIESLDIFIGFDRPTVFDVPLISDGNEDLYFTVSPSLYINQNILRQILYDHLFSRKLNSDDYEKIPRNDWKMISDFYKVNRNGVLGCGVKVNNGHFWLPEPQVDSESLKSQGL